MLALVTRPEPQAGQWVSKLRARGVLAEALPLIEIAATPDPAAVRAMFGALQAASGVDGAQKAHRASAAHAAHAANTAQPLVMFVSPNAAARFFECLGGPVAWPPGATAAATGPGTVAALMAAGVPAEAIVAPAADAAQFDSETLWALLRSQPWAGRAVWIVRGDGGRDWFADTLRAAGAQVSFVQSYARRPPALGEEKRALLAWALAQPQAVRWLLSSSEAVGHLAALAPGADWAAATALASHERIAARARELGFGRVVGLKPTVEAVAEAMSA